MMKRIACISLQLILLSACTSLQGRLPSKATEPHEASTPPLYVSPASDVPRISATASPARSSSQQVGFTATDGVKLAGTLLGEGDVAVILAHQGTPGADQTSWLPFARRLAEHGYTALAFDFRGVGRSEGQLIYGDLAKDVSGAAQFLEDRGHVQIFCIGASMGGTACIRGAQEDQFAGLVILSSTMLAGGGPQSLYLGPHDFDALTAPKLFITAESDTPVVVNDTMRMYDLSPEPKELLLLPGAQHGTDLFGTAAGEQLGSAILDFLERQTNSASESDTLP